MFFHCFLTKENWTLWICHLQIERLLSCKQTWFSYIFVLDQSFESSSHSSCPCIYIARVWQEGQDTTQQLPMIMQCVFLWPASTCEQHRNNEITAHSFCLHTAGQLGPSQRFLTGHEITTYLSLLGIKFKFPELRTMCAIHYFQIQSVHVFHNIVISH